MKASTHILGGFAAAGIALSLGIGHPLTIATTSAIGSLLPDWDHPRSLIGRLLPWPAVSHRRGFHRPPAVGRLWWPHPIWHRHQGHSYPLMAAVSLGIAAVIQPLMHVIHHVVPIAPLPPLPAFRMLVTGLVLGGVSHLVLDGFNDERQWWLWPLTRHGFRWPLHVSVRYIDALASAVLTVLDLALLFHLHLE